MAGLRTDGRKHEADYTMEQRKLGAQCRVGADAPRRGARAAGTQLVAELTGNEWKAERMVERVEKERMLEKVAGERVV
jgi:hypothetical protein